MLSLASRRLARGVKKAHASMARGMRFFVGGGLEPVFTSVYTCLFGKLCCILREKYLPGDCVRGRILLENKGVSH